jgi:hypothetical protein
VAEALAAADLVVASAEVDLAVEVHPADGNSNRSAGTNLKYKSKNHIQTQ